MDTCGIQKKGAGRAETKLADLVCGASQYIYQRSASLRY
jgi:hypothetical protein